MDKFEILTDLLKADRSVRRFDATHSIDRDTLIELVSLTRFCASGRNAQPLRYRLVTDPDECSRLFPSLAWAGYYKDWAGPAESERPTAYMVQCLDTTLGNDCLCDDGLQLQAITLGATAKGLAGCIIKAFNKSAVVEALRIDPRYTPRYVLALGRAAEKVREVDLGEDGDFRYYRDSQSNQCVPKRALADLII